MLELREYTRDELFEILGCRSKESADRKLHRWGVQFESVGRAQNLTYTIISIPDPFKVYAITELGCGGNTDFKKLREFYYYYFNDEEFRNMPDEIKESRLDEEGHHISRQTMANYTRKLSDRNMILRDGGEYYYYFAYKHTQRIVEVDVYKQAWREYWADIDSGLSSFEAIWNMRGKYGGVARKQGTPIFNAFFNDEIEYMQSLIYESLINEIF